MNKREVGWLVSNSLVAIISYGIIIPFESIKHRP